MSEIDALREGVAVLLAARGGAREAAIVRGGSLTLVGSPSRWSVGSREVLAFTVELALDPEPFAALRADLACRERVREALADAMASGATMLAELIVVLRLPSLDVPWGAAYRTAPSRSSEPPADATSVRSAAIALLRAEGNDSAADLLSRAELAAADVPMSGAVPLRRWVVRQSPADFAEAARSRAHEPMRSAVEAAATRASEVVAGVEIGVA